MAAGKPSGARDTAREQPRAKLPRLAKGSKIVKRPLPHRTGPSASRTVYVATGTPFMSVVRRVDKKLERRARAAVPAAQPADLDRHVRHLEKRRRPTAGHGHGARADGLGDDGGRSLGRDDDEEVLVVATGRAMEKALEVAFWFMERSPYHVALRSGSVPTVDEVEVAVAPVAAGAEADTATATPAAVAADAAETARPRYVTYIEIGVRYRAV